MENKPLELKRSITLFFNRCFRENCACARACWNHEFSDLFLWSVFFLPPGKKYRNMKWFICSMIFLKLKTNNNSKILRALCLVGTQCPESSKMFSNVCFTEVMEVRNTSYEWALQPFSFSRGSGKKPWRGFYVIGLPNWSIAFLFTVAWNIPQHFPKLWFWQVTLKFQKFKVALNPMWLFLLFERHTGKRALS